MNADISLSARVVEIDYETNRAIVRFEGVPPEIGIGVVFTTTGTCKMTADEILDLAEKHLTPDFGDVIEFARLIEKREQAEMTSDQPAKRGPKPLHGENMAAFHFRMTASQRVKLAALGGAAWIRAQINKAKLKEENK